MGEDSIMVIPYYNHLYIGLVIIKDKVIYLADGGNDYLSDRKTYKDINQ